MACFDSDSDSVLSLPNQPLINYLSTIIGSKNMSSYIDTISSCTFRSQGVNYCILLKSPKGHAENWQQ
jgi:hypothetical protein